MFFSRKRYPHNLSRSLSLFLSIPSLPSPPSSLSSLFIPIALPHSLLSLSISPSLLLYYPPSLLLLLSPHSLLLLLRQGSLILFDSWENSKVWSTTPSCSTFFSVESHVMLQKCIFVQSIVRLLQPSTLFCCTKTHTFS